KTLSGAKTVTIHVTNVTLDEVLQSCFKGQPFTYIISDKAIIVKEKEAIPNTSFLSTGSETTNAPPLLIDVSGKITDADGNPLLALEGRVPGLFITQSNGIAGGGVTIRLQGQTSINAANGNDPLIVIDGVPYVSQMLPTTAVQGPLGTSGGGAGNSGKGNPLS